jgi:hypothetical protein
MGGACGRRWPGLSHKPGERPVFWPGQTESALPLSDNRGAPSGGAAASGDDEP